MGLTVCLAKMRRPSDGRQYVWNRTATNSPMNGEPCDSSYGATTCVYFDMDVDGFDCARSDSGNLGSLCDYSPECASGMVCVTHGTKCCANWCAGPSYDPFSPSLCDGGLGARATVAIQPVHDGIEYGACIY